MTIPSCFPHTGPGGLVALAVKLFDGDVVSIGKAAKLAGMPQSEFIDHLGALKIPVVRYGKEELQREWVAFADSDSPLR